MVSRDDNLVAVGQLTQPSVEVPNFRSVIPKSEVSCVNQQVSAWYDQFPMPFMGIADTNNSNAARR
jgi:hypothetical protein